MTQPFACRSCGSTATIDVLSLGEIPIVNALVEPGTEDADERFPLDVVHCSECTLVQITATVDPTRLFRTYSYFSSYSQTFLEHAARFAADRSERLGLNREDLVVEAASNDGYLLQYFADNGVQVLGIEPAENVAAVAVAKGIPTLTEFLDLETAGTVVAERGHARLVVANNVLAHVPDPRGFVAALGMLAGEDGVISVEVPHLVRLVDGLQFDTIYHEHLSYFTLTSLQPIFESQGLRIVDVEELPIHGGSLRITVDRRSRPSEAVGRLLAAEERWGVANDARFERFRAQVGDVRARLRALLMSLTSDGATVGGYGAAAKAVVLANTCGLDQSLVAFVADRSPEKQGRLLPGVRIPIVAPETLRSAQPDYCVLFVWNLKDEVLRQESAYRAAGGRFVTPIPEPEIV